MKMRKHTVLKGILNVLGIILAIVVLVAAVFCIKSSFCIEGIERIDEAGTLYYAEYVGNYNDPIVSAPLNLFRSGGCSAFITENKDGEIMTCRNYDLPHKDSAGNTTGLNVVLRCAPKGKYRSLNIADAAWISTLGLPYYAGTLDGDVTKIPLIFLPYLCMDGMNEKGVSVSILALDTKEGETPMYQKDAGKKTIMVNSLLRMILDNCATVQEAVELTEQYNLANTFGHDYHLFVTDSEGSSAVFEWRYNEFTVTYTDAATNFYVGYDDACDCYYDGRLKEKFETPSSYGKQYRYGYGHGFGRFAEVADALSSVEQMSEDDAFGVLKAVSQQYDPEELTSLTQYSVIYNNSSLSVDVCAMMDYENEYHFKVK